MEGMEQYLLKCTPTCMLYIASSAKQLPSRKLNNLCLIRLGEKYYSLIYCKRKILFVSLKKVRPVRQTLTCLRDLTNTR
jgi:hypothetical protein